MPGENTSLTWGKAELYRANKAMKTTIKMKSV